MTNQDFPARAPADRMPAGRRSLDRWDNEGGALPLPTARGAAAAGARRHSKPPEDTPEGCRMRAADDLARAAVAETAHGRLRFERSAASWLERGDMLEQLPAPGSYAALT